jgi:ATP-dependent helicase/nuclease subunit A
MTAEPRRSAREEASRLQREGADPDVSAWVSASAGSGKTTLLVDRVLRLLLSGVAPDKILCLTYRRAARPRCSTRFRRSEQMGVVRRCRARCRVRAAAGRQPAAPIRKSARQLFARVLDAPGGLRVMTIHAFCQSLLRRFPLEAGVAPQFQLVEERDAAQLLNEAMKSVLMRAAAQPKSPVGRALATVTARIGEVEFVGLMKQLRDSRSRLRRHLERGGGVAGAIGFLRYRLGLEAGDTMDATLRTARAAAAFDGRRCGARCRRCWPAPTDKTAGDAVQTGSPRRTRAAHRCYARAFERRRRTAGDQG